MLQKEVFCLANNENLIVKEALMESLLILMEKKAYSEISITEIAKKAGVSRMAYYRNFDTKEDILEYYFTCSYTELTSRLPNSLEDETLGESIILHIYTLFTEKEKMIQALQKANLTNLLLEYFDNIVIETAKRSDAEIIGYHYYFFSGAFYNFFMKWFNNGRNETFEEIMELLRSLIPQEEKELFQHLRKSRLERKSKEFSSKKTIHYKQD